MARIKFQKAETHVEKSACVVLLEQFDATSIKMATFYDRSWPDRLVCLPENQHLFIEYKRVNHDLTKFQKIRRKRLQELGHAVYVAYTVEDAIASVHHYRKNPGTLGMHWGHIHQSSNAHK